MVLIINHYDSFVFNIERYINICHYNTTVKNVNEINISDIIRINPKKIVLSPGPGNPNQFNISLKIIRYFYKKVPILGICLGHQIISYYFGADIMQASFPMHGRASKIICNNNDKIFSNIPKKISVGRYHSLIVKNNKNFPYNKLNILGKDDKNEIMAVKHIKYLIYGLQFHPESILTEYGLIMIKNFLSLKAPITQ